MQNIFLSLLFWLFFLPLSAFSSEFTDNELGNRIAISFFDDNTQLLSQEDINKFHSLGITIAEISDFNRAGHLSFDQYNIFLRFELRYPTVNRLITKREQIVQEILSTYRDANRTYPGNIAAISLFSFPNENNTQFFAASSALADTLSRHISTPLYYHSSKPSAETLPDHFDFIAGYISATQDYDFISDSQISYFKPSENKRESYQVLEKLLNESVLQTSSIVIIPAAWLNDRLDQNSGFDRQLQLHMQGNKIQLPLPDSEPDQPSANWSVILLAIIWISFLIHYRNQPGYSAILTRYFTGHKFFVADVKEHRLRSTAPGFIILFQHSLLSGLAFYIMADTFFSNLGMLALTKYFPGLIIMNHEYLSFFLLGATLAILSHLISVFWIYILNKKASHFSQVLNLYSWPLHINLIIVTFLVYMHQIGAEQVWFLATILAFIVVWFMAFNLAATDCASFLEKYQALNLLFTVALHLLIVIGLTYWLFNLPSVIEPVQLALYLS